MTSLFKQDIYVIACCLSINFFIGLDGKHQQILLRMPLKCLQISNVKQAHKTVIPLNLMRHPDEDI